MTPAFELKPRVWGCLYLHTNGFRSEIAYKRFKNQNVYLRPADIATELYKAALKYYADAGVELTDKQKEKLRVSKTSVRRILAALEDERLARPVEFLQRRGDLLADMPYVAGIGTPTRVLGREIGNQVSDKRPSRPTLKRTDMDESAIPAAVGDDKAVSLLVIPVGDSPHESHRSFHQQPTKLHTGSLRSLPARRAEDISPRKMSNGAHGAARATSAHPGSPIHRRPCTAFPRATRPVSGARSRSGNGPAAAGYPGAAEW